MKIIAPISALITAVEFASSAVQNRSHVPILSNLLIEATEDMIRFTGSDLETEMEFRLPVGNGVEVAQLGRTTLPAAKLKSLLKSVNNDGSVATLASFDDTKGGTGSEKYKLSFSTLRSRYTLMPLDPNEYPNIGNEKTGMSKFVVNSQDFVSTLLTVSHSMANQDVRYYLNGLHLSTENDMLVMTATDGHRMAQNRVKLKPVMLESPLNIILPRVSTRVLTAQLKDAGDDLTFGTTSNHALVKTTLGNGAQKVIRTKLIDGRFPDVARVIPKTEIQIVSLSRGEFTSALNRAAILSNEKFRGVRLTFSPSNLLIEANNPENEKAQEEIDVSSEQPLEIGLNVGYLLTALGTYSGEDIHLHLGDANSSIVVRSDANPHLLNVVMPMRL